MLFLAQAVRLARVDHEVGVDAVALQAAVELLALADRIGRVVFALQQQRRRLALRDVRDGPAALYLLAALPLVAGLLFGPLLRKTSYDPINGFQPISLLTRQALLLLAVEPRLSGVALAASAGSGKSSLARAGVLSEEDYAAFGRPYDLQVLQAAQGAQDRPVPAEDHDQLAAVGGDRAA